MITRKTISISVLAMLMLGRVNAEDVASPAMQEERIAKLEASLKEAMTKITALETQVASLNDQLADSKETGVKPAGKAKSDVELAPLGSKWKGKTFGTLGTGQPVPNNGGPIEGEILARSDDAFTIRVVVRKDLVFTFECKLVKGKWEIDQVDADPAGAGRPGLLTLHAKSVKLSATQIVLYVETPMLNGQNDNRITYQLAIVK